MNNSSTSNSELKRFVRKIIVRVLGVTALVFALFMIRWNDHYYYHIPEGTTYSKISWINRQLEAKRIDPNTMLFVGSSICKGGINDSVLEIIGRGGANYLNFGVSHSCNAITEELLEEIVVRRHQIPDKVFLCLKADARPTAIHSMYPVIASQEAILSSFSEMNIKAISCVFKKAAWNLNFLTRFYEYDNSSPQFIHTSQFGYEPYSEADTIEVNKIYEQSKGGISKMLDFIGESSGRHAPGGVLRNLSNLKMDYLDNMLFQDNTFEKCAALLDRYGIDYDIILYPNLVIAREEKEETLTRFYQQLYPGIDFSRHSIVFARSEELKRTVYWQDMNHLNARGAELFTKTLFTVIDRDSALSVIP